MIEEIIRHELPIQCMQDKGSACYAVVPVHLSVRKLPDISKVDVKRLQDTKEKVAKWFNEDMEYYLDVLGAQRKDMPWLEGYEKFNPDWNLDYVPGAAGFLSLRWVENNTQHLMQYIRIPVFLYNQVDEKGEFCTYQPFMEKKEVEIIYKSKGAPEVVYFSPEKMLKYGDKSRFALFAPESGSVEVSSRCFGSHYTQNFAQALLFRDFGVFYMNRLLEFAQEKAQ